MQQTPPEVIAANLAFIAVWLLVVLVITIGARWFVRLRPFRERMWAQWKPALFIALLFAVGLGLAGRGFVNPFALAIFCEAMLGLALARSLAVFEPLPVARAITQRTRVIRSLVLLCGVALLGIVLMFAASIAGSIVARGVFQEIKPPSDSASFFAGDKWQLFCALLAGAGIAEETTYRLLALPLVWRLTGRRWLAVVISAFLFGAYHLTPLDGFYRRFWEYPWTQFWTTSLIGIVWGYLFVKRGFETAVLSHTLSNWLPIAWLG